MFLSCPLRLWFSVLLQSKWFWVLVPIPVISTSKIAPVLCIELLDIQETIDCKFDLKHVHDKIRTYRQMHRTDNTQSSLLEFVDELSGCEFKSCCSHNIYIYIYIYIY